MVTNEEFLNVNHLQCHQVGENQNHVIGLCQVLCSTVTLLVEGYCWTMTEEPQQEANPHQSD
jgi:hypothetical protein